MKKALSLILAIALLIGLCGCSAKNNSTSPDESATTDSTAESEISESTSSTQDSSDETASDPTDETPTEAETSTPTEAPVTPTEAPTVTPTVCTHSFKDATCTAPKTCTKCNATEGSPAGHSWNDATCTAPKTCTKCNTTEGSPAGHSWNDATCTAPKTCSLCGATEGSVGAHSFTNGACSVCNAIDSINPIDNLIYDVEYLGYFRVSDTSLLASGLQFGDGGCFVADRFFTQEDTGSIYVDFEGTRYYSEGAGFSPYHYKVTDTELIITSVSYNDDTGIASIKAIMLSSGMLKITYSTNPSFPVGTILSTNIADVV